mgnify:CR=1 FL=1
MAIVINGSGTVTGLAVGGLPDDTVDEGSLANSINTSIGAKLPLAGGTMSGNVRFPDNATLQFGAATPDLTINHDGAHSNIVDSGTGDLRIRADNLRLSRSSDAEIFLYCTTDDGVKIYHNGLEKFNTVEKGVTIGSYKGSVDTELTVTETGGNNAYIILKSNRDQSGSTYRDNAINSYARGNGDTTADVLGTSIEFASIQGSADGKIKGKLKFKVANDATSASTTALEMTHDGRGLSQFTAKAWVNFNGENTPAIRNSHNVSSVTDQSVGKQRTAFTVQMANDQYSVSGTANWRGCVCGNDYDINYLETITGTFGGADAGADDYAYVHYSIFGD